MRYRSCAIAWTTVAIAGFIPIGLGLMVSRSHAEIPTGTVCRVDEEFGVRCRELEQQLREPLTDSQTLASSSAYDRFLDIGRSRFSAGDIQGAIAYYTQAITLDGNNPQGFSLRGTAHLTSQSPHEAISDYTQALELSSGPSLVDAANYVGRGMSHSQLGLQNEAVFDATQAIAINPSFAAAYRLRGDARNHLRDKLGACTDWQQAANIYWDLEQFDRYNDVLASLREGHC
ncbi:MAG: tetratricopeptide repeat protein [Synechococcus sp.]